jgi:hypothetical protein
MPSPCDPVVYFPEYPLPSHLSVRYNDGLLCTLPPLWSSGHRFRGPRFDSRRYAINREVVGLERGPLSLVRITEELLERKN